MRWGSTEKEGGGPHLAFRVGAWPEGTGRRQWLKAEEGIRDKASAVPQQPPSPPLNTQRLFSHEDSSFQMFSSEAYGQKNLLFKDATSELVPIATQTYEAWLGPEYLHAMKGLLCDPNRKSTHLFSRCPQPILTTTMAGLSGEVARGGRPPW